jgi:hypothetical protein
MGRPAKLGGTYAAKLGGQIGLKFYTAVLKRILGDLIKAISESSDSAKLENRPIFGSKWSKNFEPQK